MRVLSFTFDKGEGRKGLLGKERKSKKGVFDNVVDKKM